MTAISAALGAVTGVPRLLLRAEGAALFVASTALFFWQGYPWWLFVVLLLAPDLSLLGYLAGPRNGAAAYNAVHSTIGPIALGLVGVLAANETALALALIWSAHAGVDRALGFGLKYGAGFGFTHLGTIGRGS
jgi:hypothetical protein